MDDHGCCSQSIAGLQPNQPFPKYRNEKREENLQCWIFQLSVSSKRHTSMKEIRVLEQLLYLLHFKFKDEI